METPARLLPLQESDLVILHRWFNDEESFEEFDQPIKWGLEQLHSAFRKGKFASFKIIAVEQNKDSKPIGLPTVQSIKKRHGLR